MRRVFENALEYNKVDFENYPIRAYAQIMQEVTEQEWGGLTYDAMEKQSRNAILLGSSGGASAGASSSALEGGYLGGGASGSTLLKPASEEDDIAAPTSSDLFKPSGR